MTLKVIDAPSLGAVAKGGAALWAIEAQGFSPDGKNLLVSVVYSDDAYPALPTRTAFWLYDLSSGQYTACINGLIANDRDIEVTDVSMGVFGGKTQLIVTYQDTGSASALDFNKIALIRDGTLLSSDLVLQVTGNQADAVVSSVKTTANGRFVAIETAASNLSAGLDTNGSKDIYLLDLVLNTSRQLTTINGVEVGGDSILGDILVGSDDTLSVAFQSAQVFTAQDANSSDDVFVWHMPTSQIQSTAAGTIDLISRTSAGAVGGNNPLLTQSGVIFDSQASALNSADLNAANDVWQWNGQSISLVTSSVANMLQEGATLGSVSSGGRYVAVVTASPEIAGSSGVEQLVLVDTLGRTFKTISLSDNGVVADDAVISPVLSSTGSHVAFSTQASNIGGGQTDGQMHLFLVDTGFLPERNPPTGTVTISGTATQGQTLTAGNTLADVDGLGTISYQWSSGGVAISGATGSSYVLTQAEVGKTITVTASYVDGVGTAESVASSGLRSGKTKYFILPASAGGNFTDFDLSYGLISLAGEQVTFVGSSAVDAVFVRPGLTIDFTLSGSGADKIYLSGSLASYTASIAGSVMTLQRGSGTTLESVSFIKSTSAASSDNVIFADGTLNSLDLYNNLKTATALPALATTETSLAPLAPAASGSVLNASIKAFALSSTGDTFAPAKPGVAMTVVGSLGVDTVYVARGGVEDCTLLGSGQDLIYFTGNWGDYTKVISGSVLTFSRTVDGFNESVRVVGSSTNISLNDHLVFADGAVYSGDAKTALTAGLTTAITAVTGYDATMTTPGIGTALLASPLNGVINLEVSSNIVLNYSANVSAVAGKYIHIVNDGGTGFHGESTVNTLNLLVTDTTQVSIVGGRVTLNPTADLDLANNYHITIDAGAFTTTATGTALAAYDGTSTLHFSTVTPGTSALANAVSSQTMNADGTLGSGHLWLDIEGIGSPSASAGTALDLSANNYALVAKDYNPAGGSSVNDGVTTGDFYAAASNFGAGDLLYIDNQSAVANDMTKTNFINHGTLPTTVRFAGTVWGGLVDLSLAGTTSTFDTIAQMKTLLGASTSPVISA